MGYSLFDVFFPSMSDDIIDDKLLVQTQCLSKGCTKY